MHLGDLKRAVEDVVLRPDDNPVSEMGKRTTIAALDLCQLDQTQGTPPRNTKNEQRRRAVTTLTSSSCSGEMLASSTESTCSTSVTTSSGQPLSMSTSLDTMVVLRQNLSYRPSLGTSRRSSRVLPHYSHCKRKRSNSVSSCMNKGVLAHHGSVQNSAGVSATTTGGASALSLPPTARHTPFRFGDFDEHSSTLSTSGGEPSPIPYIPGCVEYMLGSRMQPSLLDEWTRMDVLKEGIPRRSTEFEAPPILLSRHATISDCAAVLAQEDSFLAFRGTGTACDADNDEEMDCD